MSAAEVSDACMRERRRLPMKETKYQELKNRLAECESRLDVWDRRLMKWARKQGLE